MGWEIVAYQKRPQPEPWGRVAGAACSKPGGMQRRLQHQAQGLLLAVSVGRVPGIMDPHQGPPMCVLGWPGLRPCGPAPSAHCLTFKAWGIAGWEGGRSLGLLGFPCARDTKRAPGPGKTWRIWAQVSPGGAPPGLLELCPGISFQIPCAPLDRAQLQASLVRSSIPASAPSQLGWRVAQIFAPLCAI